MGGGEASKRPPYASSREIHRLDVGWVLAQLPFDTRLSHVSNHDGGVSFIGWSVVE